MRYLSAMILIFASLPAFAEGLGGVFVGPDMIGFEASEDRIHTENGFRCAERLSEAAALSRIQISDMKITSVATAKGDKAGAIAILDNGLRCTCIQGVSDLKCEK